MAKLSPKETFVLVLVVNIVVYVLGYQLISGIFTSAIENATAERDAATEENVQLKADIEADKNYIVQIETLTKERNELYKECYPNSETEKIHKFMNEKAKAAGIGLNSLKIDEQIDVNIGEEGAEIVSPYKINDVTIEAEGSYDQIIDFLTSIEDVEKTSALRGIDITPSQPEMNVLMNLQLFCVDKENEKDDVFSFTFEGPVDYSKLQLNSEEKK